MRRSADCMSRTRSWHDSSPAWMRNSGPRCAQGRTLRVEQALSESLFAQRIQPNHWTKADVLREYGPPAQIIGVHNFKGDIWVWRYADGPVWRLLYIDVDPGGTVRGYSVGDESLPDPPDPR